MMPLRKNEKPKFFVIADVAGSFGGLNSSLMQLAEELCSW